MFYYLSARLEINRIVSDKSKMCRQIRNSTVILPLNQRLVFMAPYFGPEHQFQNKYRKSRDFNIISEYVNEIQLNNNYLQYHVLYSDKELLLNFVYMK